MTFIEKEIRRTATMLARWQGKAVTVYGPEGMKLGCVEVVIYHDQPGKNLLIACIEPQSLSGPRHWIHARIILRPIMLEDGTEGVELTDEASGVRILAGTFEVKENVKLKQ